MTEADNELMPLMESGRLPRLFGIACCRPLWHHLSDTAKRMLDLAEIIVDSNRPELRSELQRRTDGFVPEHDTADVAVLRLCRLFYAPARPDFVQSVNGMTDIGNAVIWCKARRDAGEPIGHCDFVLDIFTPRPTFPPEWRTPTVLALAQLMYDTREFSAMPILADALQDADCDDEVILSHCRGPGPHVRGCWCVDAILERA